MTPTGYDSVIFSNVHPALALKHFYSLIKIKWPAFVNEDLFIKEVANMEVGESFFEFFFSKNRKMSSFHERNGYSLDAIGEGCFLVIIRFVKHYHARVTVKKEYSDDPICKRAYTANLKINDLYEYTVVTPSLPAKSKFSKYLVDSLIKALEP